MLIFIKLTNLDDNKLIVLNPLAIINIIPEDIGSFIYLNGEKYLTVKETPAEIMNLIEYEKQSYFYEAIRKRE